MNKYPGLSEFWQDTQKSLNISARLGFNDESLCNKNRT